MNVGTEFDGVRKILLDPSPTGSQSRRDIAQTAAMWKALFGVSEIASAAIGTFGLLTSSSQPITGTAFFLGGALAALVSYDGYTIASNVERLYSSIVSSAPAAISSATFVEKIAKDTLIAKPLLGTQAIYVLDQKIQK
jgi:hypothetical protein